MKEEEVQEKLMQYREMESRIHSVAQQKEIAARKAAEITSAILSLEDLTKKGGDILVPLSEDLLITANVPDVKNVLVKIGADIIMNKTPEDARSVLETRRAEIENIMKEMDKEMTRISNQMQSIGSEMESLSANEKKAG